MEYRKTNTPEKDITHILEGWEYDHYEESRNIRKIHSLDEKEKIQIRNPLGLIQLETTGRPDGIKPFGYDSVLDFYQAREKTGNCDIIPPLIRQEYNLFNFRSSIYFLLEEYENSMQDSDHNIQLINLTRRNRVDKELLHFMELGYPITIFNFYHASISHKSQRKFYDEALEEIDTCFHILNDYEEIFDLEPAFEILDELKSGILLSYNPKDKKEILEAQLQQAIENEEYEKAVKLREQLKELE